MASCPRPRDQRTQDVAGRPGQRGQRGYRARRGCHLWAQITRRLSPASSSARPQRGPWRAHSHCGGRQRRGGTRARARQPASLAIPHPPSNPRIGSPPFPLSSCRQPRAVRWRRRPVELRQGHLLVAHHERGPVPHGRRRRGWCRGGRCRPPPPRPLLWPRWGPTPVRRGGGRGVAQPLPRGTQPPSLGLGRVVEPGPRRRRSQPPPPLPPRTAPCLCRRRLLVVLGASSSSSERAGQQRLLDGLERCRLPHLEAAPNSRGARWCGPCRAGRRRGGGRDNRGRDWVGRGSGRGIGGCAGLAARHAGAALWCGGSLERRSRGGRCGGRGPAEPVPPLPPPWPRSRPRTRASEQWAHAPDPPWHHRRDAEVIAQARGRGRAR
jgi:hypothetical protein